MQEILNFRFITVKAASVSSYIEYSDGYATTQDQLFISSQYNKKVLQQKI